MLKPGRTGIRASRLVSLLVLLIMLALLAAVLSACTGASDEPATSTSTTAAAVSTTGSVSTDTTATTESAAIDLGKAEAADGDPALVVETAEYGQGPADQVLILMAEGKGRPEAETVATQLGGTIVGEVEYIGIRMAALRLRLE